MNSRNIKLAYLLNALCRSWFWLGIWVLFYLRFTNYAGVGILETVYILVVTVSAIPSGAVADLLGKRRTLILGFFLLSVGQFLMGAASSFYILIISLIIVNIGGSFYDASMDALVFDTLKERGEESKFDKVIANMGSLGLVAPAVAGAIGGWLYSLNPSFPYFASATALMIGCLVSFFLTEPSIDTEKFSFHNFISQSKQGWRELTKTSTITKQTILLLSVGVIITIVNEVVDSMLGIELGFNETQLGVLWAVIYLASAGVSQLTPKLQASFSPRRVVFFSGLVFATSLITSPLIGMTMGSFILLARTATQTIYYNFSSILINKHAQSKYRATTLSTFNMLRNIPYVLTAYLVGSLADLYSARNTALFLGLLLMVFLGIQYFVSKKAEAKLATQKAA